MRLPMTQMIESSDKSTIAMGAEPMRVNALVALMPGAFFDAEFSFTKLKPELAQVL